MHRTGLWRQVASNVVLGTALIAGLTAALAAALPAALGAQAAGTGTVRGRVIETGSNAPIPTAQVVIVGTRLGAATTNGGTYSIAQVPAGQHTLRVVRLGYAPQDRAVTVAAGGEVVADFSLARTAVRLDEVVTTATGEQSRRAIGNVVASMKVDSVSEVAPVQSMHEVLSGRIAGVQVLNGWGMTGSTPTIRIRGANSISLSNEPLWIVDGVRIDNSSVLGNFAINPHNRSSTFNPSDVESMDVIKGPSAAALYGTAAANGVIIITTKRGSAGRPQWSTYGEYGRVSQPAEWPDNYRSWGRALVNGVPSATVSQCRISNEALGLCSVDSLTRFNPLTNDETSPYSESTPRRVFGLQVSGGSDRFTYFLAGESERETGPYSMPAAEVERLTTLRGKPPRSYEINPNVLRQTSLRGNFSVGIGGNAQASVSSAYFDRRLQTPFEGSFFQGIQTQGITAPGFRTAFGGYAAQHLGDMMSVYQPETEYRFVGSGNTTWAPYTWLSTRATVGIDQAADFNEQFSYTGEGTNGGWGNLAGREGGRQVNRSSSSRYSVDFGATATFNLTPSINSKTTVGGQWFRDAFYQTAGSGYNLPPGASTVTAASTRAITETTNENATYGAFIEEVLSHRDRLFLTFGGRTDRNSAFGRNAERAFYPRAALSYVISEEGFYPQNPVVNRLRLRSAYGSAGVQPSTIAALQYLSPTSTVIGGSETPALQLTAVGNATLKPEVTTELEFGADIGLWRDRVNVEATYFRKKSKDALIQRTLPPSIGAGSTRWENIGAVENKGYELSIDFDVLRTNWLSFNVNANGSKIDNEILDLGGVPASTTVPVRNAVVGYPIAGFWSRPITGFDDANGDGVIVASEVTVGDSLAFRGPSLPTRQAGLTTTLGLFRDRLNITTQFDYRGGHYIQWGGERDRCVGGNCRAVNDPTAPIGDQASAIAVSTPALGNTYWGYLVPNDFIRFRELSVSYALPTRFVQMARARRATLVLSGRNLGIPWTRFPGIDPEMNGTTVGNNANWSSPPLRYFIGRVNLSF